MRARPEHRSRAALWLALVAVLTPAARGAAQERDPAAAQALFDEAKKLMNAGRHAEACPKLAESQRLDPGLGTQFNLASCYEQEGKLATAWATFLEVASLATASGQEARAQAASRRASLLEGRLPRLRIVVPEAARAPGLEITRGGGVVGEAQWSVPVPVDPGEHAIEVTAPGRRAFAGAVSVAEGATATFEVPQLEVVAVAATTQPSARPSSATSAEAAPSAGTATTPAAEPTHDRGSSGPSGLVIGLGVGALVAIGAGSALGLVASGKHEDSKAECDDDDENLCSPRGKALRDDALLFANLSTVAFAVGGAALATAAVLWLTEGGDEPANEGAAIALEGGLGGVGVELKGRF